MAETNQITDNFVRKIWFYSFAKRRHQMPIFVCRPHNAILSAKYPTLIYLIRYCLNDMLCAFAQGNLSFHGIKSNLKNMLLMDTKEL